MTDSGSSETLHQDLKKAEAAKDKGSIGEAFELVVQYLGDNPIQPRARLLLAELFYRGGCPEIAVEEVRKLRARFPNRESLGRLLEALDPLSPSNTSDKPIPGSAEPHSTVAEGSVIAQVEFELDDIELLDE
ncbi:hypothetical protein EBR25_02300 [bacterium]|nr:hypothetical protein [bacterium]